jgi:hypothetical protein
MISALRALIVVRGNPSKELSTVTVSKGDGLFGLEHFAMVQLLDGAIIVGIQLHDSSQLFVRKG